jgi:hypothetical protein
MFRRYHSRILDATLINSHLRGRPGGGFERDVIVGLR